DAAADPVVELAAPLVVERAVARVRLQERDVLVRGVLRVPDVPSRRDVLEAAAGLDLLPQVVDLLRRRRRAVVRARGDGVVVLLYLGPERVAAGALHVQRAGHGQ